MVFENTKYFHQYIVLEIKCAGVDRFPLAVYPWGCWPVVRGEGGGGQKGSVDVFGQYASASTCCLSNKFLLFIGRIEWMDGFLAGINVLFLTVGAAAVLLTIFENRKPYRLNDAELGMSFFSSA